MGTLDAWLKVVHDLAADGNEDPSPTMLYTPLHEVHLQENS